MQVRWRVPQWTFTVLVSAGILWLTLAPRPTGGLSIRLFENQDKVSHAVMFGALAWALCYDSRRARHPMSPLAAALSAIAAGGVIEILQEALNMGRTAEWADFAADTIGVILAIGVWCL